MNEIRSSDSTHPRKPNRMLHGLATGGKIASLTIVWLLFFGLLAGLAGAGAVTGYIASIVRDEPIRTPAYIEEKINENSLTGFAYFNDGSLIGQLRTEEDRRMITYDEIPQIIIDAVVAIEDKNFFTHSGIDSNGLLRAIKQQLLNESVQTGGSTITQQVARRVFLNLDQTSSRKVKEIFLSLRLERYLDKEEIMTAYLNKIPYGNSSSGYQVYGLKAAAKGIFGVEDLFKLNIAQAAYLAGVPQLPSRYSAFTGKGEFNESNFNRAVDRTKLVLRRMLEENKITEAQYESALVFDLRSSLAEPTEKAYNTYPYLMLEVERQAAEQLVLLKNPALTREELRSKDYAALIEEQRVQLLRSGYQVKTTIDKDVYNIMRGIAEDPKLFAEDHPVKGVEQVAGVLIDHSTGAILGMIEGRDFHIEQMNFATQMTRQPGSAIKPIAAYLPALDRGLIQPASILDDAPIILKNGGGGYHIPKNYNNRYSGLVTARDALNNSYNLPALKIFLDKLTIEESWTFVKSLGITTLVKQDYGAQTGVIGGLTYGTSVEELTNAYAAIANNGIFNDAYMIEEILDIDNNVIYKHKPEPVRVVSEQAAFLMTDMLRTVITNGSGASIKSQFKNYGKIPIVGKTGTTQNYSDVWFEGYTPDVTLGVWIGYEKVIHSLATSSQGRARLIWSEIMSAVTEAKPELFPTQEFTKPDGLVTMNVSSVSGKLPTDLTISAGRTVSDLFDRRYIPTEEDQSLVNIKYISYDGVNYLPHPETPGDLLREDTMVIRETPLDSLMEELKLRLPETTSGSRKPLSYYLPRDAALSAPSLVDPRQDDGAVPDAVANVSVETLNQVARITFTPSKLKDVAGYRLYRSINGEPFEKVENSVLTGEEAKFINYITKVNNYRYYVTAVDIVGKESSPSEIVNADTGSNIPDPNLPTPGDGDNEPDHTSPPSSGGESNSGEGSGHQPDNQLPEAPAGLSATRTDTGVSLNWQAVQNVAQYQIWFSEAENGKYRLLGTTASTNFSYVSSETAGWYRVTAMNEAGVSSKSSVGIMLS